MCKPDIVITLQSEGFELKRKGSSLWAHCPLHTERTPSFRVDPMKQYFHCYGCHAHGDVIDFIQKYRNLSFQEALKYLGICDKPYRPDPKEIRKRQLLNKFREWCNDHYDNLCSLLRCLWKSKQQVKDETDLEKLVPFYHQESAWLHQIEILQNTDDRAKLELYQELNYGH